MKPKKRKEKHQRGVWWIDVPIYNIGLTIFIKHDLMSEKELIRDLKKTLPSIPDHTGFVRTVVDNMSPNKYEAMVISVSHSEDCERLSIVFPSWFFKRDIHRRRETVSHEVSHIVDRICNDFVGMPCTADTTEPRAYLMGYIVDRLSRNFGLFD